MKTDTELQQDVMAELKWEPSVNAAKIGVEVTEGVVILAGHVSSYAEKWNAEAAAQRVAGVKSLTVEMDVKLMGLSKRNDIDIAQSVQHILQWTSYLADNSIKIMVEGGWITLTGDVDWEYQRTAVAATVRYLTGVTGVTNKIHLNSKVSLSAIKSDIEKALKRQSIQDAPKINVEVKGSDVILSGTVHSWAERNIARHSAWCAPGVHKVIDNIILAY